MSASGSPRSPRSGGSSSSANSSNPLHVFSPANVSSLGSGDDPEFVTFRSYAEAFAVTVKFGNRQDPSLILDWYVKLETYLVRSAIGPICSLTRSQNGFPATRYDDRIFVEFMWPVLVEDRNREAPWRYMRLYALKSREWDLDICMNGIRRAKRTLAYHQKNLRRLTSDRTNVDRTLENYLQDLVNAALNELAAARRLSDEAYAQRTSRRHPLIGLHSRQLTSAAHAVQEVKITYRLPGWPANTLRFVPTYAIPPGNAPVPNIPRTPPRGGRADNEMQVDRTPTSARRASRQSTSQVDTPRARRGPRMESKEPRLLEFDDVHAVSPHLRCVHVPCSDYVPATSTSSSAIDAHTRMSSARRTERGTAARPAQGGNRPASGEG